MKNVKLQSEAGFTIVELLVAMSIFVSVLGIIIGIFVGSLRAERSLVSFMGINDNASLALEQMAREMRTGIDFALIDPTGSAIAFKNGQGETVAYMLENDAIARGVCVVPPCGSTSQFSDFTALTGNRVTVSRLFFDLVHLDFFPEVWPPRITIRVGIESEDPDSLFAHNDIQTTVSARAQEP
jgi:type II secretory pathway pseudopilin PulG